MLSRLGVAALMLAGSEAAIAANDDLTLAPLWSDHMVIQRDTTILVEGRSIPSAPVSVRLGDATTSTVTNASGQWRAEFPALKAGGPYSLVVQDARHKPLAISDIMVGDVWLCSGQSNMELPVSRALNFEGEMGNAGDPMLRMLTVPKAAVPKPQFKFAAPAAWMKSDRNTVPDFSAACYFMGKDLRSRTSVAIGLVDASWGGTQIKAWLSPEATRTIYGADEADLLKLYNEDPLKAVTRFAPQWEGWWRSTTGDAKGAEPWNDSSSVTWSPVPSISPWERWPNAGMATFNGWVWAKREVRLTAAQARQGGTLLLGVIDEMDQTWVNGHAVGNSFGWDLDRAYRIPTDHFKSGDNTITVAMGDSWGVGGFVGPATKLRLELADGSIIPLGEGWQYSKANVRGNPPRSPWDSNAGLGLIHNGMIAPLGSTRFKGAVWYQGESDVGLAGYDKRLTELVKGWRRQFDASALPVVIVSLANFGAPTSRPVASGWAELREEQRIAVRDIPATALVQAIDIGDRTDIHPANKNELGSRLARAASILTGIETKSLNGPQVRSAHREGETIVVEFGGVNGALQSWNAATAIGFELCGATQESCRFASATAHGSAVHIAGDGRDVREVRYAWSDSPVVNLFDGDNLPVEPFRVPVRQ